MHFIIKYYNDTQFEIIDVFKTQIDCVTRYNGIYRDYPLLKEYTNNNLINGRFPFDNLSKNVAYVYIDYIKSVKYHTENDIKKEFIVNELNVCKKYMLKEKIKCILS